jgi:hypothetical protein
LYAASAGRCGAHRGARGECGTRATVHQGAAGAATIGRPLKKTAGGPSIPVMLRRTLVGTLLALAALLLASCGARAVGYGVVLWGDMNALPRTGDVVPVVREMAIDSAYLLSVPGERNPREYPMGRIRLFRKKSDAAEFARTYADNLSNWAVVMKQDPPPLPIRETPMQDGKVVYKLRGQQLVKVVSRSAEKVTIKPYTDYWYEVATEDGFSGWCFGHFLKQFSVSGDPTAEAARILGQDETLDKIMGTTWRPDWFREMLAKGAIDLPLFREDVGLFPDPVEKVMKLVLPLSTFEFRYTDVQKLGPTTYAFTGTDLRITVLDEERINVSYRYKDQPVTGLYAIMKDDVAEAIAGEQKRRADLFGALMKKGATLSSSAYGTIRLQDGMKFSWDGFGRLVPSLIDPNAKGKGVVDFPLHLSKELASDYDGVITFLFDPAASAVGFLYKAAAGGLRFTPVARGGVQGLVVTRMGISPVVMFFTQSP